MRATDAAYQVLKQHGKPLDVQDLLDETLALLGLDREPKRVAQIYTEINLDVRFVYRGSSQWGLKEWSPKGGVAKTSGGGRERTEFGGEDEDGDEGEDDEW
ncbi:MAG: DNA-directed RNA polymerase subunit delta [Firmicutes bacterium]|nr:DNA-directed RNA polymerase subunit delta [Alicyclobacillaceae bacterium]MCL6496025.1 DNA-directed RNA polymerase subunit delta [Bacillota bacterium]